MLMQDSWQTLTEAEILAEVVAPEEPTLSRDFARAVLSVRFNSAATRRIRKLLQKNNAGTITSAEKSDLEKYLRVGQFLDLMQAKARLSRTHALSIRMTPAYARLIRFEEKRVLPTSGCLRRCRAPRHGLSHAAQHSGL